jgi:hypothetical protein
LYIWAGTIPRLASSVMFVSAWAIAGVNTLIGIGIGLIILM